MLNAVGRRSTCKQNIERKAAEAQKTLAFLDVQLPQFKKQLEASEEVYNRYRNQKGTVAFSEEATLILGQAVDRQTKLLDAQQRRRELESRASPPTHPPVQTLDSQIAALQVATWASIQERIKGLPAIQQEAVRMERDVKVNTELYQSLLNNALQLRLVKEGKIGNVRVLDEAVVPDSAGQAEPQGASWPPRWRWGCSSASLPPSSATPSSSSACAIRTRSRPTPACRFSRPFR